MSTHVDTGDLADALIARAAGGRIVAAIAGAPGAGKSTLAETLAATICKGSPDATAEAAAVLPMDGYHYDDRLLDALGRRPRKGAPDTFDTGGYRAMLMRLRANEEEAIAVPVFDRDIEIARAGARLIARETRIIITEGNYLLLRQGDWASLGSLFDVTIFIDASEALLRQRLEQRWRGYGLSEDAMRAKLEENDLPNGRLVMSRSAKADYVVRAG